MIEITLNDSDFQRGLSQLLRNATHTAPMMRGMAQELENLTKDNFASESWDGNKWSQSKAAAANSRARIDSNMKYAAIHHFGGQADRGRKLTLPARHYLPIDGGGKLQPGS